LFVLSLLFLSNFATVLHLPHPGPVWTLAIEEQFYLLWPSFVRKRTLSQLSKLAFGIAMMAVVLRVLFALKGHSNYFLTFLHCDSLAVGALLACHFSGARVGWMTSRRQEALTFVGALVLGVGFCVMSERLRVSVPVTVLSEIQQAKMPINAMAAAIQQTGIVLVAGSLIGLVISNRGSEWLAVLRSRLLTFFGLISYALYMVHLNVARAYDRIFGQPSSSHFEQVLLKMFVALVVSVLISLLSRYVLELPAMSLRNRVLSHPSPTADAENPPLPLANM
jgi:peptidoglycan/LPS O-acetylase OafA/YrhL